MRTGIRAFDVSIEPLTQHTTNSAAFMLEEIVNCKTYTYNYGVFLCV
jgi:hypothetical protein